MSLKTNSCNRFLAEAELDPTLVPGYTTCTLFDNEMLGGIHGNTRIENFIKELSKQYEILAKPISDSCTENCRRTRRLLKEKKEQLNVPNHVIKEGKSSQKQVTKHCLKRMEGHSPFCSKKRRRTSVVRKAIADCNKAKALKVKEEREKRQNAALNRRQGVDIQGNMCSVKPTNASNNIKPKMCLLSGPKPRNSQRHLKREKLKEANGALVERQKTSIKLKKISSTKKRSFVKKANVLPSCVEKKVEKKQNKADQELISKPIKGVLKKKSCGRAEHDKSVRFDETTITFDIEKVSLHDATNFIYNFDERNIPSWASDENFDLFMKDIVTKEDPTNFVFHPSFFVQY